MRDTMPVVRHHGLAIMASELAAVSACLASNFSNILMCLGAPRRNNSIIYCSEPPGLRNAWRRVAGFPSVGT